MTKKGKDARRSSETDSAEATKREGSKKDAPDYYVTTGQLGGRSTLTKKGSDFFSRIAKLRHKRNRDARTAALRKPTDKPA